MSAQSVAWVLLAGLVTVSAIVSWSYQTGSGPSRLISRLISRRIRRLEAEIRRQQLLLESYAVDCAQAAARADTAEAVSRDLSDRLVHLGETIAWLERQVLGASS